MPKNIDKYKADLQKLIEDGELVRRSLLLEAYGDEFEEAILKECGGDKKTGDK